MNRKLLFQLTEIDNAQRVFMELSQLFQHDEDSFRAFASAPTSFLRNHELLILKNIQNKHDPYFLHRFSQGIRNILRNKCCFDPCAWNKVKALIILYALCGKSKLSIDQYWKILPEIIETAEIMLDLKTEVILELLQCLKSENHSVSPIHMITLICQQSGYFP